MSSIRYCDGADGECRKDENEAVLCTPDDYEVAQALVDRGWFYSIYDLHICEDCISEYYNEEDEQLALTDDGYIILGKDFKRKEKK